jgi:hypothetical protein
MAYVILLIVLIPLARGASRWLAARRDMSDSDFDSSINRTMDFSVETDEATKREAKAKMMRDQLAAKVQWGATDREIREWLEQKHGITGSKADEILTKGLSGQRKMARAKTLVTLICSGALVALAGIYLELQLKSGVFMISLTTAFALSLGITSLAAFLQSVWQLLTGKTEGAVD